MVSFACAISLLENPSFSNRLKSKEVYSSSAIPSRFKVSSPKTNTLNACCISNAPGSAASMFLISFSSSPFSIKDSLFMYGESSRDIEPITYLMISFTSSSL